MMIYLYILMNHTQLFVMYNENVARIQAMWIYIQHHIYQRTYTILLSMLIGQKINIIEKGFRIGKDLSTESTVLQWVYDDEV